MTMRKPIKPKGKLRPKMDAEDRVDAKKGIKQSPAEERADRRKKGKK